MNTIRQLKGIHAPRQRGAVAIMFGLSLLVLFGFMALVFDLGRTYVVRTELQNAADAAALAGAKDLNKKLEGVTKAIATAKAIGLQNDTKFSFTGSTGIVITDAMISVSSCPDLATCTWTQASTITSDAQAGDKTFLKVDTSVSDSLGILNTFFADIGGNSTTRTYGLAVAGWFLVDISPIGVCAIQDTTTKESRPEGEALPGTNELAQFGFRRGVSYDIFKLGPLGAQSDPYLLDAIDSYPNECIPPNSNPNISAPFICQGSSAFQVTVPGFVYGNTGLESQKIERALNSRFNDYSSPKVCSPEQAPPDINIKHYGCTGGSCVKPAADWMAPNDQTITPTGIPTATDPIPAGITSNNKYGVLWSYSRAVSADTSVTPPKPGTPFAATAAAWETLYPAPGGPPEPNGNFPGVKSPYLNDSTAGNSGTPDRRVLNLVIADCPKINKSGICPVIPVLGIGRFFMQVPANFTGGAKLEVEFAGLIDPLPPAKEVRLYK